MRILLLILTIFILYVPTNSVAQEYEFAVLAGVGGNTYIGDLNQERNMGQFNAQIGFNRYVDERSFFKFSLNIGSIQGEFRPGDDLDLQVNPNANTFFRADVLSADISFNWEIIQWGIMHLYTGTGIGFMDYRIEDRQGRNLSQRPDTRLENEDYNTRIAYFPINLGITLFPRGQFNLIWEYSWNLTNTDYLDNIGYSGNTTSDWIFRRMIMARFKF